VPRINCPEHGVHLLEVPWAREGSGFRAIVKCGVWGIKQPPVRLGSRL
jgi:hypothetical protein